MLRNRAQRPVRLTGIAVLAVLLAVSAPGVHAGDDYEPVVTELLSLMESRPDLRDSVDAAIGVADLKDIKDMDAFIDYLDGLVTLVPTEREVVPEALKFYYIVNQAPGDALNDDEQFNAWMKDLVQAWGAFLDTPASAAGIETFRAATNYNIDDYIVGPSGWQTFNQFFAREVKSGRRPIAEPRNDKIVVSPADAVFMGQWPIDENSNITVKGATWAIAELLDGTLNVVDGDTYQFNQERGLVVIDSPEVGLVAVLPIGMAYVSSVNLTTEVGAELRKGDPFGYFMFGGSDIVMVFQDRNVVLDAEIGKKYLQGQRLGELK